jgi:uroporphyrin-III C-methyltransferase/precorrin-2 dehydrogenase/sirohydrochlorin ferrochelatase
MPPRIEPLPTLPLFHKLAGRRVVVVGASDAATWKAELLAAAGADVVRLTGGWKAEDLEDAAIAIADLADRGEALRFIHAARDAGAIVNLVDQPELSDVQFGTIVNRAPLVIGISTDGAAPMLGQSIRTRIESMLPPGLSRWTSAAKSWRGRLKQQVSDFTARRRFWERFVNRAWHEPDRVPSDDDFDALLKSAPTVQGRVTIVGVGPGDPELLTLKAVHTLQIATVILHERAIDPGVLELARREAKRTAIQGQDDVARQAIELARAGESVVRLMPGDPLSSGEAAKEVDACRSAGVEVSVVPGVGAANEVKNSTDC